MKFIKNNWVAVAVFVIANIFTFRQMYFKGLIPFPADLLVSFFFPWNSGGWSGFNPWTTHKEYLAADAIRQLYPWRSLAFDLIKNFQWPLWNPYSFSGNVLLANLQTAFFFPGNILFLFLPQIWAWVGNVVFVMTLFGFFTYLFLKSLKVSNLAAIFGGLVATSLPYLMGWQEILVNAQSVLFLPLILLCLNKRWLVPSSLLLAASIFGGHIQTTTYVYIVAFLYMSYLRWPFIKTILVFILSLLIASVQLLPTAEIYLASARETAANIDLLARTTFPWPAFLTLFASDFFGNTATLNLRTFNYADARAFIGVPALLFLGFSVFRLSRFGQAKFFVFLAVFGIIFSTWPGALIFNFLHIPVLSSVVPARLLLVATFAGAILSAHGFDIWLKEKFPKKILLIIGLIYVALWLAVLIIKTPEALVSRNNLILPTVVFFTASFLVLLPKKLIYVSVAGIFLVSIFEYGYYFNKHHPFALQKFVFPSHPVLTWLQKNAGVDRFYGFGTAYLDNNFSVQYRIFSAEGYDPLYIKRYGQLVASANENKFIATPPRSDAQFTNEDSFHRSRLFDILGIKYILDKNDLYKEDWEPENYKFPPQKYKLVWQSGKFKIYERLTALPRVFLASGYEVNNSEEQIITRLFDANFDPAKYVILESDPHFAVDFNAVGSAEIVSYSPNKVVVKTQSDGNKILFLSDTYFPGWKATIDGQSVEIFRANFALRAVPILAGSHEIIFTYDPLSFKLGLLISGVSIGGIVLFAILRLWRKKK